MLKWIAAAVLAVMTVPAQAVQFLQITGEGSGAYITPSSSGPAWEPAIITFSALIPLNGYGCGAGVTCGTSGTSLYFLNRRAPKGEAEARLNFSSSFDPWSTTPDDFLSGWARGGSGSGPGWEGNITRLTITLLDLDPADAPMYGTMGVGAIRVGVPEPAIWAMMIAGFGLIGAAMRRRPQHHSSVVASSSSARSRATSGERRILSI
jgi:hypothetical protein